MTIATLAAILTAALNGEDIDLPRPPWDGGLGGEHDDYVYRDDERRMQERADDRTEAVFG